MASGCIPRNPCLYQIPIFSPSFFSPFGLPEESCEEVAARRQRAQGSVKQPLVLVADDELLIRATIVEILRAEGYDAVGVQDGLAAVECAAKLSPDVFLTDVSMPRMNGIDAAKHIRQSFPDTRVICFSGHAATSELLAQARQEGNEFEFLAKPIRPDTLIRTIRAGSA
jgi:CheY-like chemotaxis protein